MRITPKQFATERVRCAQSTMHDILYDTETQGTSLMPRIHAALGWPAPELPTAPEPDPLVLSPDAHELARLSDLAPDDVKKKLLDDARMYLKLLGIEP